MTTLTSNAPAADAPATDPATVLEITGLGVRYDPAAGPQVDDVSLRVRQGAFVAVVGESGSGKTTLGSAIMGLLPRTAGVSGSIRLDGRELLGLSEKDWNGVRGRGVAYVPQDPGASLNPVTTIGSQLGEIFLLGARGQVQSRAEIRARSIELLTSVGIDQPERRLKQYPHQLSGGLKQRVLLAIAFGLRPRLLVADEPTSALDVTVQKQVLEVFDSLVRDHGTTVLFITHDLGVATDHASDIVVMRGGQVVEHAPTDEILRRPAHAYTASLLAEASAGQAERPAVAAPASAAEPALAAAAETDAIVVDAVSKVFGHGADVPKAVDAVSLRVREGTTLAIVGESGSGKSTLARMIVGLLAPTSGRIVIHGQDVTAYSLRQKRVLWQSVQLVYQNPDSALDPRLTVRKIVEEPLKSYRVGSRAERRARVEDLLDQVGLPRELAGRRPRELSGGQRQRVAIARAIALNARILVLDEALSALDVLTQRTTIELLTRLQQTHGLTYVFISHDLDVVRGIADDVAVFQRGTLVETGPVAQVFAQPATAYTRALLDAIPGRRIAAGTPEPLGDPA
jgi:peptide/nickel transport system ATP-binding protein